MPLFFDRAVQLTFYMTGFDEGVAGHISYRDPIMTDHFCMDTFPSLR